MSHIRTLRPIYKVRSASLNAAYSYTGITILDTDQIDCDVILNCAQNAIDLLSFSGAFGKAYTYRLGVIMLDCLISLLLSGFA